MSITSIKLLALVLMFIDHVGEFIPGTPFALRMIGRISAPLFIFCSAWGFHHTHNRKLYLIRLYICSALMGIMDFALNTYVGQPYVACTNNIFSSLFCIFFFIYLWEESPTRGTKTLAVIGYCLSNMIWLTLSMLLITIFNIDYLNQIITGFIPTVITCEGGIRVVVMGLVLYFCKGNRKRVAIGYGAYCLILLLLTPLVSVPGPISAIFFYNNIQWMQIGALPFMLAYNGERGLPLKYFFYIFYPLHIMLLFGLGNTFALA